MAFEKRKFLFVQRFHRMISDSRLESGNFALRISRHQRDIAPGCGNVSFERGSVFSHCDVPRQSMKRMQALQAHTSLHENLTTTHVAYSFQKSYIKLRAGWRGQPPPGSDHQKRIRFPMAAISDTKIAPTPEASGACSAGIHTRFSNPGPAEGLAQGGCAPVSRLLSERGVA